MGERIDIGIDGGGTGCRVAVSTGARLARAEAGPANIVTDPAAAEAAIRQALSDALSQLNLSHESLSDARITAGLAGARLPGAANAFATRLPFLAYVVDDSVTALEGAFSGAHGTLVNLGTGSFFIRRDARGLTHHGGWGFEIGDEGSAAWLGRRALVQLMQVQDGRMPQYANDPLTHKLLEASPPHPVLFARDAGPDDFAALAPLILNTRSAWADELRTSVVAVLRTALADLGHPVGAPWVLTGGLGNALLELLTASQGQQDILTGLVSSEGGALDGALSMARALP